MEELTSKNDLYEQFIGKWCKFTRIGDDPIEYEMHCFGIVKEIQLIQKSFYNEIYTFFVSKADCEKDMRLSVECLEEDIQTIKTELNKLLEI